MRLSSWNPLVTQLLKNFPNIYGTWRFVVAFMRAFHSSLSWARWSQSRTPNSVYLRHILYYAPTQVSVFLLVSFLLAFSTKSYTHSSSTHTCYMPSPCHLLWRDHCNQIWRRIQIVKHLIMQFSPMTSSLLSANNVLRMLFSNTFSICSSPNVTDQVSYPYKIIWWKYIIFI
jgi:hypothetical protein